MSAKAASDGGDANVRCRRAIYDATGHLLRQAIYVAMGHLCQRALQKQTRGSGQRSKVHLSVLEH